MKILISFIFILIIFTNAYSTALNIRLETEYISISPGQDIYLQGLDEYLGAEPFSDERRLLIAEDSSYAYLTIELEDSAVDRWEAVSFRLVENGAVTKKERQAHYFKIPAGPDTLSFFFDYQRSSSLTQPFCFKIILDLRAKSFGEGVLEGVSIKGPEYDIKSATASWGELTLGDEDQDSIWQGSLTFEEGMYPSFEFKIRYLVSGEWFDEHLSNCDYHFVLVEEGENYPELTLKFDGETYAYQAEYIKGLIYDGYQALIQNSADDLFIEKLHFRETLSMLSANDIEAAEQMFIDHISNKPDYEIFYMEKIRRLQNNNQPDDAYAVLNARKELEFLTDEQTDCYLYYEGNINLQKDSTDKAVELYNAAMQSAYSNVKTQAALRLHKIYLERDDKNSAIAVLNEVINTCEKDDKLIAYDHLTAIYEDEKDYEQTIETLNSKKDLLSMRQGYIIDYRIALLEVLELGEYESGINRLDNLLNGDISPLQERRYTYGKGLALRHKGDLEEAKEVFNSIIERWPESYESKLSREELELLETDEEEE